jgi:hypothetical protein
MQDSPPVNGRIGQIHVNILYCALLISLQEPGLLLRLTSAERDRLVPRAAATTSSTAVQAIRQATLAHHILRIQQSWRYLNQHTKIGNSWR